jgi:hypothetical protein
MSGAWPWNPSVIVGEVNRLATNSSVAIVETDLGLGYLKALGGKGGPHPLACELVGTALAARIGLRTLDYGLIEVRDELRPTLGNGKPAEVGPAFITRAESGNKWGGSASELRHLANPNDVAGMVVFDTWTQNCDRYFPREGQSPRLNLDNVFLSRDGGPGTYPVLKPIDHGCCFTCDRELTPRNLSNVMDETVYGWFPGFTGRVRREDALPFVGRVESITRAEVEHAIACIPAAWKVEAAARTAWADWILARGARIRRIVERDIRPVDLLDDPTNQEGGA